MSYVTYTSTGPFNPGGAPGISATFLNAIEAFLSAGWFDSSITSNHSGVMTSLGQIVNGPISPSASPVTPLSGSTSGTATLYQPFQGTFKLVFVVLANFRNGGGSAQTIALPTPFTAAFYIASGDINSMQMMSSASAQSINIITALASAGGAASGSTTFGSYSLGACNHAADTLSFNGSNASTHTGVLMIAGI